MSNHGEIRIDHSLKHWIYCSECDQWIAMESETNIFNHARLFHRHLIDCITTGVLTTVRKA